MTPHCQRGLTPQRTPTRSVQTVVLKRLYQLMKILSYGWCQRGCDTPIKTRRTSRIVLLPPLMVSEKKPFPGSEKVFRLLMLMAHLATPFRCQWDAWVLSVCWLTNRLSSGQCDDTELRFGRCWSQVYYVCTRPVVSPRQCGANITAIIQPWILTFSVDSTGGYSPVTTIFDM